MKIIALEEHFRNAAIEEAVKNALSPGQRDSFVASRALSGPPELEDLGIDCLKHMDAMGINVQVLSYTTPGTQVLPAAEAVPLARDANDQLTSAIAAHPDRFAGFATLPTSDPEAAAAELERTVHELGWGDDQWANPRPFSR